MTKPLTLTLMLYTYERDFLIALLNPHLSETQRHCLTTTQTPEGWQLRLSIPRHELVLLLDTLTTVAAQQPQAAIRDALVPITQRIEAVLAD